jgi:endogenous inhibitor of DNA gyrase (YacG/DUF329 family)
VKVAPLRKCPVCKRPLAVEGGGSHQPFCSKRCADIDLWRWLNGSYAIPAAEDESEAEGEGPSDEDSEAGPEPGRVRH